MIEMFRVILGTREFACKGSTRDRGEFTRGGGLNVKIETMQDRVTRMGIIKGS